MLWCRVVDEAGGLDVGMALSVAPKATTSRFREPDTPAISTVMSGDVPPSTKVSVDRAVDTAMAAVIVVVVTVVVGVTAQSLGFTRDEGYYFKAAELYAEWFRELVSAPTTALSATGINALLGYNPEHPFVMKGWFALSRTLQQAIGLDVMGHNAMRLPAWITSGVATALVYALARAARLARAPSLMAALWFISLPHVFWHMHVACFDVAVTAAHAGLVAAWLRYRHSLWGTVLIGVVFGLCAATKHNVLPVPALFVLHWLLCEAGDGRNSGAGGVDQRRWRLPLGFVTLAVIAPVVYVALWPWLWPDVVGRFGAYVGFHLRHEHYPIMLFGELLTAPPFPWSFPLVMWGLTIPVPLLSVGAAGLLLATVTSLRMLWRRHIRHRQGDNGEDTVVPLGDVARSPSGSTALLLLLNAAFPVFLIALPSSPIFGGTKHWMNALPFVCVLGAWSLQEAATRLRLRGGNVAVVIVVVVVGVLAAVPGLLQSARVWPNGLGAYNELAGFSRGAANLGLQRTFWGYEIREALPAINERAPRGARLHGGDVNQDSFNRYRGDGLLRPDMVFAPTVRGADVAHVEPLGEFKQQQLDVWNEWQRRNPDIIIDVEGVPLSTVTFRR
jgi:hypothetical protein